MGSRPKEKYAALSVRRKNGVRRVILRSAIAVCTIPRRWQAGGVRGGCADWDTLFRGIGTLVIDFVDLVDSGSSHEKPFYPQTGLVNASGLSSVTALNTPDVRGRDGLLISPGGYGTKNTVMAT